MITAIKITRASIHRILAGIITQSDKAAFTFACLTTAYNGEDWFYVNSSQTRGADFTRQIMPRSRLLEEYSVTGDADTDQWFEVWRRESASSAVQ